MNKQTLIEKLRNIKAGIETDRFTMENIDYLIKEISKAELKN